MKKSRQSGSTPSAKAVTKSKSKAVKKKSVSGLVGEISEATAKAGKSKVANIKPTRAIKAKKAKPSRARSDALQDKVQRDAVALRRSDRVRIKAMKADCQSAGVKVKKSELLRAGLLAIAKLTKSELLALIGELPRIKPARAAKKSEKRV